MELMVKTPFDDINPEYGLHGYQLHLVLNTPASELMSQKILSALLPAK